MSQLGGEKTYRVTQGAKLVQDAAEGPDIAAGGIEGG